MNGIIVLNKTKERQVLGCDRCNWINFVTLDENGVVSERETVSQGNPDHNHGYTIVPK